MLGDKGAVGVISVLEDGKDEESDGVIEEEGGTIVDEIVEGDAGDD